MQAYTVSSGSVGRRRVVQGLFAMLFSPGFAADARAEKTAASAPFVRISRGSFAPEEYEAIKTRLDAAQKSLVPAIRRLAGCLHYFAAIDRESSSLVNVSVWRSLADAQQMQTLGPMLALAEEFTRDGVRFERPVVNYETLWQID
jgi:quinol monooxygenase YgiN